MSYNVAQDLDEREHHANADIIETSLLSVLTAKNKLKRKKNDFLLSSKKKRVHPWHAPPHTQAPPYHVLRGRRASVFGTILKESEKPTFDLSFHTKSRRYRFVSRTHTTEATESELKKAHIMELDSRGQTASQLHDDNASLSSSSVMQGFPTSMSEKRKILAKVACNELHVNPKRDLYSILRDRYDPDHCESPMDPLYSFKALCMRESLLFHPSVRNTLNEIWRITDSDKSGSIDFKEYEKMHECMSIAVYGSNYLKKR